MSDNSDQPQDLGQKLHQEWEKFRKNTKDVQKEIEDVINSVGEKATWDWDYIVQRVKAALDKLIEKMKKMWLCLVSAWGFLPSF